MAIVVSFTDIELTFAVVVAETNSQHTQECEMKHNATFQGVPEQLQLCHFLTQDHFCLQHKAMSGMQSIKEYYLTCVLFCM